MVIKYAVFVNGYAPMKRGYLATHGHLSPWAYDARLFDSIPQALAMLMVLGYQDQKSMGIDHAYIVAITDCKDANDPIAQVYN
jgi:hypothetical protein